MAFKLLLAFPNHSPLGLDQQVETACQQISKPPIGNFFARRQLFIKLALVCGRLDSFGGMWRFPGILLKKMLTCMALNDASGSWLQSKRMNSMQESVISSFEEERSPSLSVCESD